MNWKEKYINQVVNIDCLQGMQEIPDNSIDLLVTDPPYQLSSIVRSRPDQSHKRGEDNPFCYMQAKSGFMNKKWDVMPSVKIWKESLRILKPGAFAFILMTPRQDSLSLCICRLMEAGFKIEFSSMYWTYATGFPKANNISKAIDKKKGYKRKGIIKINGKRCNSESGIYTMNTKNENCMKEVYETGEPLTDEAKKLDGSYGGFQPKPAVEVVIVAMKPLSERNYIEQALQNGKGVTWLNNCRIPVNSKLYQGGRFPANLLVSDDVLNNDKITKSIGEDSSKFKKAIWGKGDTSSYSRFFDLDKWYEKKMKELNPKVKKVFPFFIVSKSSSNEKDRNINSHPTVKPIKLISYLITLGSRKHDIIFDPFAGSGTTGIASFLLDKKFIMFEKEKEYYEIIKARLNKIQQQGLLF